MNSATRERVVADLIVDEGVVLHAYQDHLGYWTLGVGHLIDKRKGGGITYTQAMMLLEHDIESYWSESLTRWPWMNDLDPVRQACLCQLAFNLGIDGLAKFAPTLEAIRLGDYESAVRRLKASLWYRQVATSRSDRIMKMLREGGDG